MVTTSRPLRARMLCTVAMGASSLGLAWDSGFPKWEGRRHRVLLRRRPDYISRVSAQLFVGPFLTVTPGPELCTPRGTVWQAVGSAQIENEPVLRAGPVVTMAPGRATYSSRSNAPGEMWM